MDAPRYNENQSEQVDIRFLIKVLKAVMSHMLIIGAICAVIAGALRYFTTTPTYSSGMTYYVNSVSTRSSDGTIVITPGN